MKRDLITVVSTRTMITFMIYCMRQVALHVSGVIICTIKFNLNETVVGLFVKSISLILYFYIVIQSQNKIRYQTKQKYQNSIIINNQLKTSAKFNFSKNIYYVQYNKLVQQTT